MMPPKGKGREEIRRVLPLAGAHSFAKASERRPTPAAGLNAAGYNCMGECV